MLSFPNGKINLGLSVLNKREDGFHDLETVFYPINYRDALEITTYEKGSFHGGDVVITNTGLPVDGEPDSNLCVKAYHLLKKDFPDLPPVKINLHKVIPMGAGLGGGSSDAAFMLRMLNDQFQLTLTRQHLIDYAVQLGSDCPFFIINKPCFATSRGEMMEEIRLDLSGYVIALINPGVHVNTGWAFKQLAAGREGLRAAARKSLQSVILEPVATWKDDLYNDFERPVFEQYPEIAAARDALYAAGASYAAMSGSGSTLFGLFDRHSFPHPVVPGWDVIVCPAPEN